MTHTLGMPPKFELLWRNKFLTLHATTIEDMIEALSTAIATLTAMKDDGVTLDPNGGAADDYARLVTTDAAVAATHGMQLADDESPTQ